MLNLFAIGCLAVILFPDRLHDVIFTASLNDVVIPFNGWSGIHLMSTFGLLVIYPKITFEQYWVIVIGWEVVEQYIVPSTFPSHAQRFVEERAGTLSDLLVAVPASILVAYHQFRDEKQRA